MDATEHDRLLQRGVAALKEGRYPEAIESFVILRDNDPNSGVLASSLAAALVMAKRFNDALHILEPFTNRYPPEEKPLQLHRDILAVLPPPPLRLWSLERVVSSADYLAATPRGGEILTVSVGGDGAESTSLTFYRLNGISVLGHKGALVGIRGEILRESTPDSNIEVALHPLELRNYWQGAEIYRRGEFVNLNVNDAHGFYHWFMDQIPRVMLAERAGFCGTYIIPRGGSFIRDSLLLLGISEERLEVWDGLDWRAEKLWVLEQFAGYRLRQHPGLARLLREAFLAKVQVSGSPRRVYSKRTNPNRPRRIVNESELEAVLKKYDFEAVDFEQLSLIEQLTVAANTEALIGPHGAGIIHAMFMRERGLLIELVAPTYINPVGIIPSETCGHRYFLVPSYLSTGTYEHGSDIEAFTLIIELILKREYSRI